MRRIPTTLALSAWLGFLVIGAAERTLALLIAVLSRDAATGRPVAATLPALSRVDLQSFVLLATAVMFGAALAFLHETRVDRRGLGEGLVYAGLGLVALMASMPGAELLILKAGSIGFWASLMAALVAVTFDHLITDETPDDEEDFRLGMAAIAEAMSRQTLHAVHPDIKAPLR